MDEQKVYAHVQAVARQFNAWRGQLPALIEFVRYSMKDDAPPTDQLDNFLRRETTQRALIAFEVGLWRASDKTYRLVSLAVTSDPAVAKRRLEYRPLSTDQCRWCHIDEKSFAILDLRPELDIRRDLVPASRLHPVCMHSWLLCRALVERDGITTTTKESLPQKNS